MNRRWLTAVPVALLLAACGAPAVSPPVGTADSAQEADTRLAPPAPGSSEAGTQQQSPREQQPPREVVRTAQMTVVADDPPAAAETVGQLAREAGGYVASVNSGARRCGPALGEEVLPQPCPPGGSGDSRDSVTITVRVPADDYDGVVDKVRGLGELRTIDVSADDVTGTVTDLDARITAQQASVDRLTALMKRADSVADVVAVEKELATRQAELESLQSQRKRLADAVALATVTAVVLSPDLAQQDAPGDRHWWDEPWRAFWNSWQQLLLVAAALAPMGIVAAAAAGAVLFAVRRRGRRTPQPPPTGSGD